MKLTALLLTILFCLSTVYAGKLKVAVMPFENKAEGGRRAGEGISDILITELVKNSSYTVYDRAQIESVLKEHKLAMSGIVDPSTAKQIGKMIGVDALVYGCITEFSNKSKSNKIGGLFGNALGNLNLQKYSSRIGIDVRIIEIESGRIITSEHVNEEKTSNSASGFVNNIDFGSDGFDDSLAGRAARDAVRKIVKILDEAKISGSATTVDIVKVNGNTVFVSAGAATGIAEGDSFSVYRIEGEQITDLDGNVLAEGEERLIGTLKITEVKKNYSIGNFQGNINPKRGDKARAQ